MCQPHFTTACFYNIITAHVNQTLPPYVSTSQTRTSAMLLSCNGDTVITTILTVCSLLLIITVVFLSPVKTKIQDTLHYGVQSILYRGWMKHFKPNLKYIACPCKSLSLLPPLSLTHTHTHTHTQSQIKPLEVWLPPTLVQTVQYRLVTLQHSSIPTIHSTRF